MKKILLTLNFCFSILVAFAQGGPPPVAFTTPNNATFLDNIISENNKFGRVVYAGDRNASASNKVLLFDNDEGFVNVYMKDGHGYKVPNANFDLITQQLQVDLKEEGKIFTFDRSNIDYFVKNNKKYVFVENVTRPLHEELLKSDKTSLLKGYEIIRKEAMTNPLTNEITKPAHYEKGEIYYISKDDTLEEIPSRTSKFVKLFKDDSDKIKDYISENRLSTDEDKDLIKIISYYNNL